eukprot:symbB.v1.2.002554.t1/scaffold136.1/size304296/7
MSTAPPAGAGSDSSGGMRRRPVQPTHAHYDWHVAEGDGDCDDEVSLLVCCPSRAQVVTSCQDQDPMVFQEEQPSKFQEYMGIFFDYIFWILLAYCAVNAAIWLGEKMGPKPWQQVILLQVVQLAEEFFKKFKRIAPGLYKAVSHPYSFVKTHTFSNLPIAMVLSLLPVTFRIILVAASCGEVIAACSYEAVAKLRSDVVKNSLDMKKLEGQWYEQTFHDFAQVGASCQRLWLKTDPESGSINSNFSVIYGGGIHFSIQEHYRPPTGSAAGVFRKFVSIPFGIPGGSLFGFPSAIVDVVEGEGGYEALIVYSCLPGVQVLEISTRAQAVSESMVEELIHRAFSLGINLPKSSLRRVRQSQCEAGFGFSHREALKLPWIRL